MSQQVVYMYCIMFTCTSIHTHTHTYTLFCSLLDSIGVTVVEVIVMHASQPSSFVVALGHEEVEDPANHENHTADKQSCRR